MNKIPTFSEYYEAVSQQYYWHGDNPLVKPSPEEKKERIEKFSGMPRASRLGFTNKDREMIERGKDEVEKYLNKVTEKWGIHWLLLYIEPKIGSEPGGLTNTWGAKDKKGNELSHWDVYEKMSNNIAKMKAMRFMEDEGLDPNNTIVYIKHGSRVHGLSVWQQLHNIGHAVLDACSNHNAVFIKEIQRVVQDLQQRAYDQSQIPPSEQEITVVLSRLLNNQSLQSILALRPGDLNYGPKLVNTAFNSYQELIYDLFASFLRNGGKLPLRPRDQLTGRSARAGSPIDYKSGISRQHNWMGRTSDISNILARQEIDRKYDTKERPNQSTGMSDKSHFGPTRDFAWLALANDKAAWEQAAKKLERILYAAIKCSTWGRHGGPVHATSGYLTYDP